MSPENSSRREFLQLAAAAASVTTLAESVMAQTSSASATGMPTRILGRTGVRVSILGVGGAHAGRIPGAEGERFVHMAVDEGSDVSPNGDPTEASMNHSSHGTWCGIRFQR